MLYLLLCESTSIITIGWIIMLVYTALPKLFVLDHLVCYRLMFCMKNSKEHASVVVFLLLYSTS
jgi:hypothetical protein